MKKAAISIRQIKRYTGAVRNVVEHSRYLAGLGYSVTILAEKKSDDILKAAGANFVKISQWPIKGGYRRTWFDRRVQKWLRDHPVDLHFSHGDSHTNSILVLHNCVRLQQELAGGPLSDVAPMHDSVIRHEYYQGIIANSELMKRDLVQRYGVPEEKVHVFYQGVDTHAFNASEHQTKRQSGRKRIGLGEEKTLVGLVTSGDFRKRNVAFFIDVANELVRNHPIGWHFVVVGKSDTAPYRDKIDALGLSGHFSFLSPIAEVDELFHALDLHLFPAQLEEFGRVILEGLACGTPSLVSNRVGASEVMTAHNLPMVVDGYDPKHWAGAAYQMVSDKEKLPSLRKKSEEAAKRYSMEEQAMEMARILKQFA